MYRINDEVLHPMGLAISRVPYNGASYCALIAGDGVWQYDPREVDANKLFTKDEISVQIKKWSDEGKTLPNMCTWKKDPTQIKGYNFWTADCGYDFPIEVKILNDEHITFCPNCGRPIESNAKK